LSLSAIKDKTQRGRTVVWGAKFALLVDAAVEPADQIRRLDSECFGYSKKSLNRDWSTCLDLLPVAGRKSVADHVFLRITAGFP